MLGPVSSSTPSYRSYSSPMQQRVQPAPSSTAPAAAPVDRFERASTPNPSSATRSLTAAPLPAAAPALSAPARDLGLGATGADVMQLQRGLVALGHLRQVDMDTGPGTFGPRTQAALREFQTDNGVPPTGFYGPMSRSALGTALANRTPSPMSAPSTAGAPTATPSVPRPGLEYGMQGPPVEELQRALVAAGAMTQAEMDTGPGIFGMRTDAALRAFQAKSALPQTGYYGPQTQAALANKLGVPVPPPSSTDVPPEKPSVIGAPLGDGTVEGALTWSKDQLPGGTLQGQNHMAGNQNGVGAPALWDNWCLGFVNNAYGQKVPELQKSTAYESYQTFNAEGRINPSSTSIPAGAPVFFAPSSPQSAGHIAIATGKTTPSGEPIIRSTGWPGHSGMFEAPLSELQAAVGTAYLGYAVM